MAEIPRILWNKVIKNIKESSYSQGILNTYYEIRQLCDNKEIKIERCDFREGEWYTIFFSNESQLVFKKEELDFQVDKQLILEF